MTHIVSEEEDLQDFNAGLDRFEKSDQLMVGFSLIWDALEDASLLEFYHYFHYEKPKMEKVLIEKVKKILYKEELKTLASQHDENFVGFVSLDQHKENLKNYEIEKRVLQEKLEDVNFLIEETKIHLLKKEKDESLSG